MTSLINSYKITDDMTIEFTPNPKRPGFKAHARYEIYSTATTLAEYYELLSEAEVEKKYSRPDLRYDEEHGHLKIFDVDGNQVNMKENTK